MNDYLGEFEQILLFALLELGDEAYGGAIRQAIEERTGRVASSGAIYTAMARLADRRFVSARIGQPVPGRAGRPRKYYSLEPAGARALRRSYATIQAMAGGLAGKLDDAAEG
ncbi:MAG: PadR family transcriptional regulator [Acidobacteria bacterium]|nr:PadR family transcriptional regulator [Acidobacteriota bacterium]